MVVKSPKVFYCVKGDDGPLVVLPTPVFVILKKPQRPRILKKAEKILYVTVGPKC
jgi:hypothetical protein